MYTFLKSILFLFSAESAHRWAMLCLGFVFNIPFVEDIYKKFYLKNKQEHFECMGLKFANKVGIAAGFDKNASYMHTLSCLGFGHIEIGTVTPKPQEGNLKPRLFRLTVDEALINRMGFNNKGVEYVRAKLQERPPNLVIGVNIGKNKATPNEKAVDDYLFCFEQLYDYGDYFVVNVSSPNTPGLRALQEKGPLTEILNALMRVNRSKPKLKPILLKIAPDLNHDQLADVAEIVVETGITGLIATNTTISRADLHTTEVELNKIGMGGLSGKPLYEQSTEVLGYLRSKLPSQKVIIGVGGIDSVAKGQQKLNAGASLIQIYTGFIYQGPALVKSLATL